MGKQMANAWRTAKKNLEVAKVAPEYLKALEAEGKVMGLGHKIAWYVTGGASDTAKDAIRATGGDIPWYLKSFWKDTAAAKVPGIKALANAAKLTPESKGREAMEIMMTAYHGAVVAAKSPEDAVKLLRDFVETMNGKAFAHAWYTMEGRVVQNLSKGSIQKAESLLADYQRFGPARKYMDEIADILNVSAGKVAKGKPFKRYKSALVHEFLAGDEGVDGFRKIRKLLEDAGGTPDDLAVFEAKFGEFADDLIAMKKGGVAVDDDLFRFNVANAMVDNGEIIAIEKFGIQQDGAWKRFANAVKTAETVVFLRANPGYVVRNVINNEATMLARGILGVVPAHMIDDLYDWLGALTPVRQMMEEMGQGTTAMYGRTMMEGAPLKGGNFRPGANIDKAINGEASTMWDKFSRNVSTWGHTDEGKPAWFDMFRAGQYVEKSASRRAFSAAFYRGWKRNFWRAGAGFDEAANYGRLSQILDPSMTNGLNRAIESIKPGVKLDDLVRLDLTKQAGYVIDDFKALYGGTGLEHFIPDNLVGTIHKDLQVAMDTGDVGAIRRVMNKHTDNLLESMTQNLESHANLIHARAENIASLSGPEGIAFLSGQVMDDMAANNLVHNRIMRMVDDMYIGGTPAQKLRRWEKFSDTHKSSWARRDTFMEKSLDGIAAAVKDKYGESSKMAFLQETVDTS
ncbi:MAG: hypothetical protein JRC86_11865, partial [Deltaproteobacteria bacterium]|nr:hypothetical protein [Deltaproteobacteria bacterium]